MDIQARLRAKLTGQSRSVEGGGKKEEQEGNKKKEKSNGGKPRKATDGEEVAALYSRVSKVGSGAGSSGGQSSWSAAGGSGTVTTGNAGSSSATSGKEGADDDAGLKRRPATKRARGAEERGVAGAGAGAAAGAEEDSGRHKRARKQHLDVSGALSKLQTHMGKDKKFVKVAALLQQLVEGELNASNAQQFYPVLAAALEPRVRVHADFARGAVRALFRAVADKAEAFAGDDKACAMVDVWCFRAVTHNELFTDDTFQFNRAGKVVLQWVERVEKGDGEVAVATRQAVIEALGSLHKKCKRGWAKTAVNQAFEAAAQRRLLFDEASREQLDTWYNNILALRHGRAGGAGVGGGVIAPSGVTGVRQLTAVGVFHPHFNRNR